MVDQLDGTVVLDEDTAQYCVTPVIPLPFVTVNVMVVVSAKVIVYVSVSPDVPVFAIDWMPP